MIEYFNEDFQSGVGRIPDGSVDLVLTDPPYGTMRNSGLYGPDSADSYFHWDSAITPTILFDTSVRLLRPNGRLILFAQEPYTSLLVTGAIPAIPFSYRAVWIKDVPAVTLGANRNMVNMFEDVLIFKKRVKNSKDKSTKYPTVFNLWEGRKSKYNVFTYKKDPNGFHPTQKPVALLSDLIKTFTNTGDLVVDLTMGSGSTGIACHRTGRKFIGFELDEKYYTKAIRWLESEQAQLRFDVLGAAKC